MPNRMISLERNTNETQIELTLDLDGTGRYEIDTGCGFLNHMLELFARHGRFDLVLTCHGDVQVDYHHTTEDVGIALGQAFARALGEYGSVIFIAGNQPFETEIAPLMIISRLEEYDYAGATTIAVVMLVLSFAILFLINLLQAWASRRTGRVAQ